MAVARTKASAVRAQRALLAVLLATALWFLLDGLSSLESDAGTLVYKLAVLAVILALPVLDGWATRISRKAAPWVLRHETAWRVAKAVVYSFAPLDWFLARLSKMPGRLLKAAACRDRGRGNGRGLTD